MKSKSEIALRHAKSLQDFIDYIGAMSENDYLYQHNNEKWSAGEQLDHVLKVEAVVAKVTSLPKFALKLKFGKSNRPSKSFEQLVDKYSKGIQAGFKANGEFVPTETPYANREKELKRLAKYAKKINKNFSRYSEGDLDTLIVPHPALGILTMREMFYFNTHHTEDHLHQTKRNLGWRDTLT